MDDLELAREYKECVTAAYDELCRKYKKITRDQIRWLGLYALSNEDIEDIQQETWLIFAQTKNRVPGPERDFRSWIKYVARHSTVYFLKKYVNRLKPRVVLPSPGENDDPINQIADDSPGADYEKSIESWDLAMKKLSVLTPKDRNVFILRYFHDLSIEKIAKLLRLPKGTVGSILHRAKKKLRSQG